MHDGERVPVAVGVGAGVGLGLTVRVGVAVIVCWRVGVSVDGLGLDVVVGDQERLMVCDAERRSVWEAVSVELGVRLRGEGVATDDGVRVVETLPVRLVVAVQERRAVTEAEGVGV